MGTIEENCKGRTAWAVLNVTGPHEVLWKAANDVDREKTTLIARSSSSE